MAIGRLAVDLGSSKYFLVPVAFLICWDSISPATRSTAM
ncbi:hypothetical protein E2C01_091433 [Portunus trituberculatus]|uniref:Uncharacterized protein n=1 Tax=Portunus trituberculatus TaxID=210409 RepID=A0A5B7JDY3_PORTR|nr:hypothetical protein [Portunus trituberculatus]